MKDPIEDKTPKPPGILPKRMQSWIVMGIAFLMVLIMWLTGGRSTKNAAKLNAPQATASAPVVDVNLAQILDLQKRIQQLQSEHQRNGILGQQSAPAGPFFSQGQAMPAGEGYTQAQTPLPAPADPIDVERQTRAYKSLFASNVALSYRKELDTSAEGSTGRAGTVEPKESPTPSAPSEADLEQLQVTDGAKRLLQPPNKAAQAEASERPKTAAPNPALVQPGSLNQAEGKNYVIFEGTILEALLMNRLDGYFSGPISCLLTNDIYSHDRQHLLIPAGSKILGETRKVDTFGQSRLAVLFHRIIMPDGYSVSLHQFKGLNQIGETALRDKVNNHYARIFGASLAIGALGGVAQVGTGNVFNQTAIDRARQGFGASMAQSAERILDKFLNILPTVTIREGHRVKIYLSNDLIVPDYQNHTMPADL